MAGKKCRSSIRPGIFAETGIVLLTLGVGGLIAVAGGAVQPSRQLLGIISVIIAAAVASFIYAAILTIAFLAVAGRPHQKSVSKSDPAAAIRQRQGEE